jgi:hypothetical protein
VSAIRAKPAEMKTAAMAKRLIRLAPVSARVVGLATVGLAPVGLATVARVAGVGLTLVAVQFGSHPGSEAPGGGSAVTVFVSTPVVPGGTVPVTV